MSKIAVFKHLKACAEAAKNFTAGLVGELAETASEALEELENAKADKPTSTQFVISPTNWKSDSTAGYPYYYDIQATGVTANDIAMVAINTSTMDMSKSWGICPASETLAGVIRIRAASMHNMPVVGQYWIEKGKE